MRVQLQIDSNASISLDMEDVLLIHENTRKNLFNVHTLHGEIVVLESSILPILEEVGFVEAYTRFNPSTAANAASVKTPWEEGQRYRVWYSRRLPIVKIGKATSVLLNGRMLRIEN